MAKKIIIEKRGRSTYYKNCLGIQGKVKRLFADFCQEEWVTSRGSQWWRSHASSSAWFASSVLTFESVERDRDRHRLCRYSLSSAQPLLPMKYDRFRRNTRKIHRPTAMSTVMISRGLKMFVEIVNRWFPIVIKTLSDWGALFSHDRGNYSSCCSPGGLLGSITLGVRYFWLWRPRSFPFGVEVLSFVPLISGGVILHHSKCNYPRKPSLFHVRKTFKKLKMKNY